MHNVIEIAGWIIVASLVVLVVTHAGNTAQLITASSNAVTSESRILTGN